MADIKYFAKTIDDKAREQVERLAALPAFSNSKIRIMPDVHAGAGCVIGFTADLGDKVIPNVVGVDIGCGMLAVKLGEIAIDFEKLDNVIKKYVPSGFAVQSEDDGYTHQALRALNCKEKLQNVAHLKRSLGTLGGGNHFIEIDEDSIGRKWLVIHTGSRNLGKQVAEIYQQMAIDSCEVLDYSSVRPGLIEAYKTNGWQSEIPHLCKALSQAEKSRKVPKELCYLEGDARRMYLHDMAICQRWARLNRMRIAEAIVEHMGWKVEITDEPDAQNCFQTVHNYIDTGNNLVRKGAVSAEYGEILIIPMNMRDGSLLCVGKGNPDWNNSAPHGAGRIMSRMEAKRQLHVEDFQKTMEGIYTTTATSETLDEAPDAYKPMDEIISCTGATVGVWDVLKPLYNFKAAE